MSHQAIYDQILALPDAPLLVQKVSKKLNEERIRRLQFYNDIDESMKVEFINGEIIVHSPVMKRHNDASSLLFNLLGNYVNKHDLGFVGYEKIMTTFSRNDYEPDLVFFGNEKAVHFKPEQTLFPVPDFVVEVLSKSTAKYDRGIKFDDYETHEVQEYWIIDPKNKVVEQYLWIEGKYTLILKSAIGTIKSEVIQGFEIPIQAIFDRKINFEALKMMLD